VLVSGPLQWPVSLLQLGFAPAAQTPSYTTGYERIISEKQQRNRHENRFVSNEQ